LGKSERGSSHFDQAVSLYEAAAAILAKDKFSIGWARLQNDLGIVLEDLGMRYNSRWDLYRSQKAFEESVAAYGNTRRLAHLASQTRESLDRVKGAIDRL